MDIISAIKSNRPFKRAHHQDYRSLADYYTLKADDIIADDWEIEVLVVPMTRDKMLDAFYRFEKLNPGDDIDKAILNELGFNNGE